MTTKQYLAALKRLGLAPYGKATAAALGVTVRSLSNYASGDHPIPATVARLLEALEALRTSVR